MLVYKKLKVNNLELLQNKIYESIPKQVLENNLASRLGNQKESINHFLNIPEFREYMDMLGMTDHIKQCIINLCNRLDYNTVHRDNNTDFSYSINIPIKNCNNTYITFYRVEDELLDADHICDDIEYTFDKCDPIKIVEMSQPIFVNITVPHAFTNPNDSQRVMLLVRVDKFYEG
jgi:hypothetical protein